MMLDQLHDDPQNVRNMYSSIQPKFENKWHPWLKVATTQDMDPNSSPQDSN